MVRIRLDPLPFQFAAGDRRFLPSLVAVGAGAGWVASARGAVARIDAASNRVVAVIRLARQAPAGIAVAGRTVWVAEGGHGMARIDAATNRLLGTIRLDVHADRVATDGGAIWVGGRSTDPSVESRLGLWPGSTPRPAVSGRSSRVACRPAWRPASELSGSRNGTAAGGALECIAPEVSPSGMTGLPALGELAVGGGAIWAADRLGSSVYRLEPDRFPCSATSVLTGPAATP